MIKALGVCLLLFVAFGVMVTIFSAQARRDNSPTPGTNAPAAAVGPQVGLRTFTDEDAISYCKTWTEQESRFAVEDFTGSFRLRGASRKGHKRVGVTYRTKGVGMLMRTDCDVSIAKDGQSALVVGNSYIAP